MTLRLRSGQAPRRPMPELALRRIEPEPVSGSTERSRRVKIPRPAYNKEQPQAMNGLVKK